MHSHSGGAFAAFVRCHERLAGLRVPGTVRAIDGDGEQRAFIGCERCVADGVLVKQRGADGTTAGGVGDIKTMAELGAEVAFFATQEQEHG